MTILTVMYTLDARGLEPPEPLVKILNTVETLEVGEMLSAQTDRRPILLLESLAERGYASHCEETLHDGYLTTITKS